MPATPMEKRTCLVRKHKFQKVQDLYSLLLVKVLKGPVYEQRFSDYVTTFTDRQREIQFALIVHTSLSVESVSSKVKSVHEKVTSTEDKINLVLLFRRLDSPGEAELMKFIKMKGGAEKCMADDKLLLELSMMRRKLQGGPVVVDAIMGGIGAQGGDYGSAVPMGSQTSQAYAPQTQFRPFSAPTPSAPSQSAPNFSQTPMAPYTPSSRPYTQYQATQSPMVPLQPSTSYRPPSQYQPTQTPMAPPSFSSSYRSPSHYQPASSPMATQSRPGTQYQFAATQMPSLVAQPPAYSSAYQGVYGSQIPPLPASSPYAVPPPPAPATQFVPSPQGPYGSYAQTPPSVPYQSAPTPASQQWASASPQAQPPHVPGSGATTTLDELKLELSEDVDVFLSKNMIIFQRKLDVQKRQLVLELTAVVKAQSDRVIKAVDAGPHDRVVDPV